MAAYAALVSVLHTIDHIQHHPHPPISLDKTQVESLTENIIFLQEFLESYSQEFGYSKEADPLEMRIADAAYTAEDVIEFHIVDRIHGENTRKNINFIKRFKGIWKANYREDEGSHTDKFYRSLQKVIEEMDLIKKEAMEIKEKTEVGDQLLKNRTEANSSRSSAGQEMTMIGFDDELLKILDQLTGGKSDREIISIVGMGGTGKTTLARNIYQHQVVVQHFHFCAWVTISQEHRIRECLLELLQEGGQNLSEHELGEQLHKRLSGRKYLIVIDDIWDIDIWDQLRRFFPDNKNGSRIVITTRISNFEATESYVLKMGFLDEDRSWRLFSKIVFGKEGCPRELVEIGKKIVESCRGLPLSIVVVGGLLAKSKLTRGYWESVAKNLNSIVNSENDERCLRILHMSYKQLPVYLKPCFLYMGVISEDRQIRVSELIKLWVGEGFLKPISGKSLEEVAYEYLHELINRNLVLAHEVGSIGKVKYCKIHDLLRDLCLRQAEKERFYNVIQHFSRQVYSKDRFYSDIRHRDGHVPQDTSTRRRVVIPEHLHGSDVCHALQTKSPARSLIYNRNSPESMLSSNFKLLRILFLPYYDNGLSTCSLDNVFKFVNLRCVVLEYGRHFPLFVSSSRLWNLQTLITKKGVPTRLPDFWNMSQLRHLNLGDGFQLPDLPIGDDGIILANLQTLCTVYNFNCSEELAKRIPNIKKLKVYYSRTWDDPRDHSANFGRLHKLETLCFQQLFAREGHDIPRNLSFPNSLKELTLDMDNTYWEDKLEKVGSLPLLQKFKLIGGFFKEGKWETVEGHFPSLKFLSVEGFNNLKYWETESSHFPCLEHLFLRMLLQLEEIPCEIGEIPTLKSIEFWDCGLPASTSAKKIIEKQEEVFGEVVLQVLIDGRMLVSMASSDSELE